MKKLREFVTIKNLNTSETKVVDDEGNIEELEGGSFDFFGDLDDEDRKGIRPDGSHDGLDDLEAALGEFDPFSMENIPDNDMTLDDDQWGQEPPADLGGEGLDDVLPGDELAPVDGELDGLADEQPAEDPDFQGVIRTVTGACLVYKRKGEEGTFEELWIYNIGKNMRNEMKIRRSILAGTDIQPNDVSSQDGTQRAESTTIGNVQYLRITGLPN
jgi:hypothetical protein